MTVTALPHAPRVAITKRLEALEGIAKRVEAEAQAQSLADYSQARSLLRDLEDLFAEHLPSRVHLSEPLPRVRQHLGAMAGLEEHELREGVHSHLEQVLSDIRKMRAALPPDR